MNKFRVALLFLLSMAVPAAVFGTTLTDVLNNIATQLPTNTTGSITAATLRGVLDNMATWTSPGGDIDIRFAKLYGMVCDNVTDDGPALQTALTASVGHRLYLPANATCRIKSYISIPSHTYLYGANSTLQLDPAAAHSGSQNVTIMADGTSLAPITDVVIDGVIFTGPGTASINDRVKIVTNYAQHWVVRNSTFQNMGNTTSPATRATTYGHGIQFFNASDTLVDNNFVTNNVGDGISFSNGLNRLRITNNLVTQNWDSQIVPCTIGGDNIVTANNTMIAPATNLNPPLVIDECTNTETVNNNITGVGASWCILMERVQSNALINQDNKIIGNTCNGSVLQISGAGTTQGSNSVPKGGLTKVIGNTVINSNSRGIYIVDSTSVIVTGNHVISSTAEGIAEESFVTPVGNNIVKNNIIDGATNCIRQVNSGGSVLDTDYTGNVVKNCTGSTYIFLANSGSDGPSVAFTPAVGGPVGTASFTINTSRWKKMNDKFYRVAYTFNVTALGSATSGTYTFALPNGTTSAGDTACSFWNKTDATTANLSAGYINSGDQIAKLVISTIATKIYELSCLYDAT